MRHRPFTLFDIFLRHPRIDVFPVGGEVAYIWVRVVLHNRTRPREEWLWAMERCSWGSIGTEPDWIVPAFGPDFLHPGFLRDPVTWMLKLGVSPTQEFVLKLFDPWVGAGVQLCLVPYIAKEPATLSAVRWSNVFFYMK